MQQTLFATIALLSVAAFTLAQNRDVTRSYSEIVDDELEIAASGVAIHVMEIASHRAFDDRTTPENVEEIGLNIGASDFSIASSFGSATNCDLDEPFKDTNQCTDLDDVHMDPDEWQDVPFALRGDRHIPFKVQVNVAYVDPTSPDDVLYGSQTSMHKKVTVKVRAERHIEQGRYPDGFVTLERIVSFNVRRAENRMRDHYGNTIDEPEDEPDPDPDPDPEPDPDPDPGPDPDLDPEIEQDEFVTICHRKVKFRRVVWTTKTINVDFLSRHLGHGDRTGSC